MKRKTGVILIIAAVIITGITAALLLWNNSSFPDDFDTFIGMRNDLTTVLQTEAEERKVNRFFEDYRLKLNPLFSFMFRDSELKLHLTSYESELIDTGSISQFEIGDTGVFFDFTFMIRPDENYSLPFFHGDALKALPGVDGALYMDFYAFAHSMSYEVFFGENISLIEEARNLAKPYWKHEGFGELTVHLDDYKSPYRFEILEPENATETERLEYFETARKCFNLYMEAYFNALNTQAGEPSSSDAERNIDSVEAFTEILYKHDSAVKMGKMIFPEEDFDRYFLEGFWGVE
ncbi:MAG: hypothetical protein PQJ61_15120 [Spirochaetales bacterium]|uniref:Uncharacterized protein n=1 Tax=Candidatus Thalassospirochaeta sargassi TaxID=3119039 RepID=A0AAJ1MK07_9SPIO|nr:hypothetical protein [Spirochaetales bacterium]